MDGFLNSEPLNTGQGRNVKGFIRQQEERLAVRYLLWHYERIELPAPPMASLEKQAAKIVADAHTIARQRGRNVMAIMKELVQDIRKDKG